MKKKVNIFLCGGGPKVCYQTTLLKKMSENYEMKNIVGLSFGALIGYMACRNLYDDITNFCESLNPDMLIPCFKLIRTIMNVAEFMENIPLIGKFIGNMLKNIGLSIWILNGIKKKGLFLPDSGINFINSVTSKNSKDVELMNLSKFWCVVYNATKNHIEIINGTHPKIEEYILASCSRWIIYQPLKIIRTKTECECNDSCTKCIKLQKNNNANNVVQQDANVELFCTCDDDKHKYNEYIDPGFERNIPFDYDDIIVSGEKFGTIIKDRDYDILCSASDITKLVNKKYHFDTDDNLLGYLDNMISLSSDILQGKIIKSWKPKNHKDKTVKRIIINYESPIKSVTDVDSQLIKKIIIDGYLLYDKLIQLDNDFIIPQLHYLHSSLPHFYLVQL